MPARVYLSALVLALAGAMGACSSRPAAGPPSAATTTTSPAPPPTGAPPTAPPTTGFQPARPSSSPDAAAAALVLAWSQGNQASADQVATPAAVQALFSTAFPSGYLQSRGCSSPLDGPATCTYRNTKTDGIYELYATRAVSGWYISSVVAES